MIKKTLIAVTLLGAGLALGAGDKSYPFQNATLPLEERLEDLVGRMTLEEKMEIICFSNTGVPRLGVEVLIPGECLHGLAAPRKNRATVFPQAIGMAASWNPDLMNQIGEAVSDEARAQYHNGEVLKGGVRGPLTFWSPVVNMARDPRWGRTQEGYGEDPVLVSEIAAAYVKGLSGDNPDQLKIAVGAKHFVANNEEHNRFSGNADISEKQLREYYFPGYKAAVTRGGGQMIMTAYNRLNGVPCVINEWLIDDVLRKEWGFDGIVIGDYGSSIMMVEGWQKAGLLGQEYIGSSREAAKLLLTKRGINLDNTQLMRQHAAELVASGEVDESNIDDKVRDVLRVRMKLGIFDPPEMQPWKDLPFSTLGSDEHNQLAYEMAVQSAVLLKNEPATDGAEPLLPLDASKIKTVAVIGPNAAKLNYGTYSGTAVQAVSGLDGLRAKLGKARVIHIPWSEGDDEIKNIELKDISKLDENGIPTWSVEYYTDLDFKGEPIVRTIGYPQDVEWGKPGTLPKELENRPFAVRYTTTLVPPVSGDYILTATALGSEYGGGIIMEVDGTQVARHWTKWNKELKVPVSLEAGKEITYTIAYKLSDPVTDQVFNSGWIVPGSVSVLAGGEVEAAAKADAVIAFMGLDVEYEREAKDRSIEGLPSQQLDLLKEVIAANPNTVVVLHNGSSIESPELVELSPALLTHWYPGQAGGSAIADLLFGDANPGGKLPLTFVKSWSQLPDFGDYDIAKGRTYWYFNQEPLFPFGYGLSYTQFDFSDLKLSSRRVKKDGTVKLACTVKNIGERVGDAVVQIYVREKKPVAGNPKRRLKTFARVRDIQPGESRQVVLSFAVADLAYWSDARKAFEVERGNYVVELAASSADIRDTGNLTVR